MSDTVLGTRRQALEEAFFAKKNSAMLEKIRAEKDVAANKSGLATVSGIQDEAVLQSLIDAGLDATTLSALSLAPMILVAWADKEVQQEERDAILKAAAENNIPSDSPAGEILANWLEEAPDAGLLSTWKAFMEALSEVMEASAFTQTQTAAIARAQKVAEAAGGFLGMGSISGAEKAVLEQLNAS